MKQTLLTDDQIKYVIESLGQRKTNADDPIKVTEEMNFHVWGIATNVIHKL